MSSSEIPTLRPARVPVVLVVGGEDRLIELVSEAAISAQLLVADCGLPEAPTAAAEMRPLVVVVPADVYETEGEGLESLARDVRSRVLVLDHSSTNSDEIEQKLIALMNESERDRPSWAGELG